MDNQDLWKKLAANKWLLAAIFALGITTTVIAQFAGPAVYSTVASMFEPDRTLETLTGKLKERIDQLETLTSKRLDDQRQAIEGSRKGLLTRDEFVSSFDKLVTAVRTGFDGVRSDSVTVTNTIKESLTVIRGDITDVNAAESHRFKTLMEAIDKINVPPKPPEPGPDPDPPQPDPGDLKGDALEAFKLSVRAADFARAQAMSEAFAKTSAGITKGDILTIPSAKQKLQSELDSMPVVSIKWKPLNEWVISRLGTIKNVKEVGAFMADVSAGIKRSVEKRGAM